MKPRAFWRLRLSSVSRRCIGGSRSNTVPITSASDLPADLRKGEPLWQLIALVEFAFDKPRGQKTAATMNPGLAYVANTWQLAAEVIVPLNSEGGHGIGARAQLLLFLDDLIPSLFGRPLLSR